MVRIGNGYDVHRLKSGNKLILGGIEIPHSKGTVGHSDGDVLIHAIIDALLGAAALKDIGYWFPDDKADFKNIDSKVLLKKTINLLKENGYSVVNIDSIIAAQKPKLKDFIDKMRKKIAQIIDIDLSRVSVKATTTEKLGFEGNQTGISVYAVALLND